jgi:hypothetical protein
MIVERLYDVASVDGLLQPTQRVDDIAILDDYP